MSALAPETPIEVWFQDEMRVGQKNSLVYQWAKTGSRPRQPKDQRAVAYVFADGRGTEEIAGQLAGFSGILQVDGYAAYKALARGHAAASRSRRRARAPSRSEPLRRSGELPGESP